MPAIRCRRRPVEVYAIQWTGDPGMVDELFTFIGTADGTVDGEPAFHIHDDGQDPDGDPAAGEVWAGNLDGWIRCPTGYWLVRGPGGEVAPCSPEAFAATYEPVAGADG